MPQRNEVRKALRFLRQNPRIPSNGMQFIAGKLLETEEEPGQTQKYLKSAYQYLSKREGRPPKDPILTGIRRLSRTIGRP